MLEAVHDVSMPQTLFLPGKLLWYVLGSGSCPAVLTCQACKGHVANLCTEIPDTIDEYANVFIC